MHYIVVALLVVVAGVLSRSTVRAATRLRARARDRA